MERCKTCKHWGSKPDEEIYSDRICKPYDEDTFEKKKMPFEVKRCCSPNITLFEKNLNSNGISLTDGSEYYASMCTGEDFGCILHEIIL